MHLPTPRALIVTGAIVFGVGGSVVSTARADVGPDPNFSIFSVSDFSPTIGSTIEVSGVGCEPGTDLTSTDWEVLLEFYITNGIENYWLSTGVVDELNPDGTWSGEVTLVNEVDDMGQPLFDAVGSRLHAQCRRVNDPEGQEVIDSYVPDVKLAEGGAAPTTTTAPAPSETTTPEPPAVDSGDGDELPVTGSSTVPLALFGGGLVALGLAAHLGRGRVETR